MAGPNFIGIGVQKCATSWLHETLNAHPDIFTSDTKEVEFFTAFYDRGYEWYESHFAEGAAVPARGETSPSYFYHPEAPARVRAYRPEMKIIVIFRDPVRRAFSNHLHELRMRHLTSARDFETGLANNPCYVEQGRYATHTARWFAAFPRDQVLALLFEEITADPQGSVRQVYEFLGVNADFTSDDLGRKSNESVAFRYDGLQKTLQRGGHMLRRAGLGGALERLKALPGIRHLMALNKQDLREITPPMLDETRRRLAADLAPEMRDLAKLLGRDSLPWPNWPSERTAEPAGPDRG
ncbi:MAG: sulfotransferase [Pseudomonadota bacterium]